MLRKRRGKSTQEEETQREEEGTGRRREERKAEQIEAKRERLAIESVGFPLILCFSFCHYWEGERDGWQGLETGLESFLDLANRVFALE